MKLTALVLFLLFSFQVEAPVFQQQGTALYYSDKLHGARTASGERYNKNFYTAAHATLPLQSFVRLTNIQNGNSVVVKINDRIRPGGKIIDVSRASASKLGIIRNGRGEVTLELLPEVNASEMAAIVKTGTAAELN